MKMKFLCQKYFFIFAVCLLAQGAMCENTKTEPYAGNQAYIPSARTKIQMVKDMDEKEQWKYPSAYDEIYELSRLASYPPTYNDLKKATDIVSQGVSNDIFQRRTVAYDDDLPISKAKGFFVLAHGLSGEHSGFEEMYDYLHVKFPEVIILRYNVGYSFESPTPSGWHEAIRQGWFGGGHSRDSTSSMSIEEQCEECVEWLTEEGWPFIIKADALKKHPLVLIGHSQGGLRMACVQEKLLSKGYNVAGLVTIGTPWKGASITQNQFYDSTLNAKMARYLASNVFNVFNIEGQGYQDLIPGSEFLKKSYQRLQSSTVPTLLIAGEFSVANNCLRSSFSAIFKKLTGSARSDLIVSLDSQHAMGLTNLNIKRRIIAKAIHTNLTGSFFDKLKELFLLQLEGDDDDVDDDVDGMCNRLDAYIGLQKPELHHSNVLEATSSFLVSVLSKPNLY